MSMSSSSKPPADRAGRDVWRAATALAAALARPRALASNGNRNDGPPDLDELWRDFNRKLSGLFGRKGGGVRGNGPGDGGPNFQPDMKNTGIGVGLVLGAIALIWLGSGFFIV